MICCPYEPTRLTSASCPYQDKSCNFECEQLFLSRLISRLADGPYIAFCPDCPYYPLPDGITMDKEDGYCRFQHPLREYGDEGICRWHAELILDRIKELIRSV